MFELFFGGGFPAEKKKRVVKTGLLLKEKTNPVAPKNGNELNEKNLKLYLARVDGYFGSGTHYPSRNTCFAAFDQERTL